MTLPTTAVPATTVFFDGACPLCRREIALYQGAAPASPVEWVDVSRFGEGAARDTGQSCGALMARFHVRTPDGVVRSGAAAFISLWLLYPGWRWLGKFGRLPGMERLLELLYLGFLRLRPSIQRLFRRFAAA